MINCLKKIQANNNHVQHQFLPKKPVSHKRKHDFVLPPKDDRNFFNRVLFKQDCYRRTLIYEGRKHMVWDEDSAGVGVGK